MGQWPGTHQKGEHPTPFLILQNALCHRHPQGKLLHPPVSNTDQSHIGIQITNLELDIVKVNDIHSLMSMHVSQNSRLVKSSAGGTEFYTTTPHIKASQI